MIVWLSRTIRNSPKPPTELCKNVGTALLIIGYSLSEENNFVHLAAEMFKREGKEVPPEEATKQLEEQDAMLSVEHDYFNGSSGVE